MFGPNISNAMNYGGQFVPLNNCLNKDKEAKLMDEKFLHGAQHDHSKEYPKETIRGQILDIAKKLTTGDRNNSYGPPIDNLTTYANLCQAYLEGRKTLVLDAVDASIFMVLAKVSRIAANRGHKDNYVDGAAYMAIAGECDELLGGAQ